MKTLINLFIFIFSALAVFSGPQAADNPETIRVIEINPDKYNSEYDKAIESDPWKGFNLAMFKFNNALDQYLVEPLARAYRYIMPKWGRNRISNIFNNVEDSSNLFNSILQGDIEGVFRSFWRMVINTGFGIGGIYDVAGGFGLKEKDKYFSQTLAVYGLGTGPYLVIPFMGPSTPRDFVGDVTDMAAQPTTYIESPASLAIGGTRIVQKRESVLDVTDDLKKNSFDLYSSYKSGYLQNRKKKVLDTIK